MKLITGKTNRDCLLTSWAMVLDMKPGDLAESIPSPPDVWHTLDFVHAVLDLTPLHPVHLCRKARVILPDGSIVHKSWEHRFRLAVMSFRGVLILEPKYFGPRHAVAFEQGTIYDPRGKVYEYTEFFRQNQQWVPTEAYVIYGTNNS